MGFMEKLENNQKSYTENGAVGYVTSGHKIVDLNFAIPSFRDGIDVRLFSLSLKQDEKLTLKWLLYLRDIRNGVGERQSFRDFVVCLSNINEELSCRFISNCAFEEYGRWDDYIDIYFNVDSDRIKKVIANKIVKQFSFDINCYYENKSISLLAKWLPSINASSYVTRKRAREMISVLGIKTERKYRKLLSMLRKYIDVVERKMSANNWGCIDYSGVPSKANLIYSDAFLKHDEARRKEYIDSVKNGKSKINANAMFLHDIVHKYRGNHWRASNYDETLEQLWAAQKKVDGFGNTIVVRDGSGSMSCRAGNSSLTARSVADAITLYCAENNTGEFKNKFITFSSYARLVDVGTENSLYDKLELLDEYTDYSCTNIENVFRLILATAVDNDVLEKDMPKTVLIVSDMEFDCASGGSVDRALFEAISDNFERNGYSMPRLVFWNVNSRTNTIPLQQNKNGVILISGFSKNLMDMVMSSELDPYKALVRILNSGRYSCVDSIYR